MRIPYHILLFLGASLLIVVLAFATDASAGSPSSDTYALSGAIARSTAGAVAITGDSSTTVILEPSAVAQDEPSALLDVEADAYLKAAERHAESAPPIYTYSTPSDSPCGDTTGLSGQTGLFGGGLSTITETCRAYRLERLKIAAPDSLPTRLAEFTHYLGWPTRTLLHFGSLGVLN